MRISLDRTGRTSLYLQIENFFRSAIGSGKLPVESRLPSARALAADLGVSRMTVEGAYAGLEAEGLVRREIGSGTFVMPLPPPPVSTPGRRTERWPQWQSDLLASCESWREAAAPDMLGLSRHEKSFSFDIGSGDSRRFPVDELRKTMQTVLRKDGRNALEYGDPRGYAPLRRSMAEVLTSQGLEAREEDILITSGSQQALALVAQLLLRPGDRVLVERPTYGAALDLFRALSLSVVDVPVDRDGMDTSLLEPMLQRYHPKLLYVIPNFQNPTGSCMSTHRRRELVSLAARYNVPILEDDFVGDLRYDGRAQPTLKALDQSGGVIYMSTFSKMLMPGLRTGLLLADGPVLELVTGLKKLTDLATSNAIQRTLHSFVSVGRYAAHLRRSRRVYGARRDAMAEAVERYLPVGTEFDMPPGGLFLWLRLPPGISARDLLPRARKNGVRFAPGGQFFADREKGDGYIRLNFAAHTPDEISLGVRELGRIINAGS